MNDQTQPADDITIIALREILFKTLRDLNDKDNPMELDRAKAINDVAQTVINSAKVEVDALRVVGGSGTGFIPALPAPRQPANDAVPGVTKHRLK